MANDEASDGSWSFQPKILYIKCKKGLSKEKIQDSIAHSLKEVSENCDRDLPLSDFHVESLTSGDATRDGDIAQVTIGPRYIGVLLKNGLVYRVRCVSKTPRKVKLSSTRTDEVPFSVSSDRSYARQLQERLNGRPGPPGTSGRYRRLRMYLDQMPTASGEASPGETNTRNRGFHMFPGLNETRGGTSQSRASNGSGNESVMSETPADTAGNLASGRTRPLSGETTLSPTTDPTFSFLSANQRTLLDNANERIRRENASSNGAVSTPPRPTVSANIHQTARRTLALAQILQQQSEMLRNFVGNQQQTSTSRTLPSSFSRIQLHTPVIRTYYPACSYGRDMLPSRYMAGTIENRRITPVFTRRGRSFPAPSIVRQLSIENPVPVFIQVGGDGSTKRPSGEKKGRKPESKKDFDWPVIGDMEWLQTASGKDIKFTKIVAMTSAFLLVTDSGQLFEWLYEDEPSSEDRNHVTRDCSGYFETTRYSVPKAMPHPLSGELALKDKCVCLIATSGIRASVLTTSGHLCTFYDKLVKDCKPGQPPSLIQELSHSALLFPALVGASIVSLDCHEFYSAVMTSSGNCYWWGLLPGAERRDLEEKLSKIKQEVHLSVGDKVKLQKIAKGSPGTLVYKIHDSLGPCVGQIVEYQDATMEYANRVKVEIVASGVEISTVNMNESGTGSPGSSQDASRAGSSPSPTMATPTQLPPLVDTWGLAEIVFLEDEQPCLGVVVGTDGPLVIVDTSQGATFYKTKLKIFKTSELQKFPNKADELEGTSTVLKKEQSIYVRFLQGAPKSVMESCRVSCSDPVASTGVTKRTLKSLNYKAISMACTKEGVVLLVRCPTDDKVYYLGPSCEHLGDCSKRFTCSSEVSSTLGNGQVSVTVKAESVLGRDSALRRNETNSQIGENVGVKRKLSSSDDDGEHDHSSADFLKSPVPEAAFPRLVCASSLCGSILLDSNGCFFPRTLNTKLNGFHSLEISPFQCFDMGERKVAFENEDYTVLVVPLVFKQQSLVKAIQTGLTSEVQKVLKNLEDMTTMNSGKGGKIKGKKKVAVQQQTQDGPVAVDKETSSFGNDIIPAVSAVLSEKVSGNRNILHLCCSNLCIKAEQQRSTVEDVLSAYKSDEKDENKDDDISILQTLLKHPLFGNEIMGKLNEKDVNGYTPFLLSLRCNNFKASLYILDYLKEKEATGALVDWKSMVYCCTSSGETPLHIVAMKSCAGLGLTGLGNSLIVLNLPSNYTPRMLLKLFQARYPSAYRAAIPPLEDVERAHSFTVWQKRERKLRGPSVAKSWKSNESSATSKSSLQVPIVPSAASSMRYGARLRDNNGQRREALEGMVTFADHKEMRKALCEMDKHVVSNEMGHPDVGVTSVVQHILHVKLAKLNAENNKDSSQMEMEYNGILYGVTSTGLGCSPKINKKNKSLEASEETQKVEEDKLVSKLVGRLLESPEVALITNGEEETALAFLVNYCKWIKPTENQKKRFTTYCQSTNNDRYSKSSPEKTTNTHDSDSPALSKPGVGTSSSVSMFPGLEEESPYHWTDFMTELKNNVSNLVKSLETIEKVGGSLNSKDDRSTSPSPASTAADGQGSKQTGAVPSSAGVRRNSSKTNAGSAKDGEQAFGSGKADSLLANDLIDLASESVDPVVADLPPVLLQLAKNWPCVAKTVLGMAIDDQTILGTLNPILHTATAVGKGDECVSETSDLDFFVQELLSDADEVVLDTIASTIVDELNKHSFSFKDYLHGSNHTEHDWSAARLALHVGQRFLRSVTRQLCFLLSHNGMAFVELPNATNERTAGRRRNATEIKQRARRVLSAFSWLSVYELVEAAEAVVSPFRDGVAKPQRSTGKDFGNVNNPVSVLHNTFPPQYGAPRGRPGIRVFGDQASSSGTNHLRTAPIRVSSDGDLQQSHHLVGVRLLDVDESSASESKSDGSSRRTQNRLFGMSRRQPSPLPTQTGDSDSDSDDDSRDRISDETDMVIDNDDRTGSPTITGITHEHPFAWALDGRLTSSAENSNSGRGINFGVPVGNISPPSVHAGNCYLARMFSRLAKEVIDVLKVVDGQGKETNKNLAYHKKLKDSIVFNMNERSVILEYSENILEKSWLWLINVMDTVEGQLYRGKHFDTKRYLVSLQQGGDSETTGVSRASLNMPGATPEEYLMFLLRSHTNEHRDTLPVMDMLCYEHAVYVLDAFFYVLNGWPKSGNSDNTETAMDICSSIENEDVKPNVNVASSNISGDSSALLLDVTTRRFFLSATTDTTLDMFATELKHNLQQSARVYVPSVSLELFDKKNSMVDLEERIKLRDSSLPVSYRGLSSRELKLPIMHQWSADEVCERWMISIDIFSRLFLAEGPGGERDSFLATRAGTAGRIARFRRALSHLRDSISTDQQQGIFGAYGFSGRMGTVLSLNVRRSHLLEDMLKFLGEMSSFHYTNFRVKFEGEEGSGPGVNRGFFAAVANALKADDKQPTGAASLLYEPGKLPEQSGYFSPRPSCRNDLLKQEPELLKRRQTMFKSIGRFLGLCLWFSNTIPLNLTRTMIKYILGSEIVWQDLAFFNADLFDGLSRMIVDSMDETISEETFQSTYCCHFEVSIARETVELVANGSHIPVTKSRTFEYARLYAQKVMVDCVQEELSAMKEGVHEIIPSELLEPLTTEDFQLLISGGTLDIDINRLKSITSFVNSNGCSTDILDRFKKWFWSIVNKMTPIQRQQLLYFATGSAMLPTMPERKENDQDDINITIDIIRGNPKALPMASTCGQRMSVPLYPSRRILKRKLLQAIQCQTYGLG